MSTVQNYMLKLSNLASALPNTLSSCLISPVTLNTSLKFPPFTARIIAKGRKLRDQLPSYVVQQRAQLVAHCPLPTVLMPLIAAYATPTHEDMWTEGWAPGADTGMQKAARKLRGFFKR